MKNLKLSDQVVRRIAGVTKGAQEESLDEFTEQYLETALWSSVDIDSDIMESLDGLYGIDDFSLEAINEAKSDCDDFREEAEPLLDAVAEEFGAGEGQFGHDFWLTRNGHGAGFWDRGWGGSLVISFLTWLAFLVLLILTLTMRKYILCRG